MGADLRYEIVAQTEGDGITYATCKSAHSIPLDTSGGQSEERFGPAELLAASLAACLLKNLTRLAPKLRFTYTRAEVRVTATRAEDLPGYRGWSTS